MIKRFDYEKGIKEIMHKVIVNTILALLFIVYNVVLFDMGKRSVRTQNKMDDLELTIDSLKKVAQEANEKVVLADSIAAVEIGKLREDMVTLSRLREMTLAEVKNVQLWLAYEKSQRDSIGNTLIEW